MSNMLSWMDDSFITCRIQNQPFKTITLSSSHKVPPDTRILSRICVLNYGTATHLTGITTTLNPKRLGLNPREFRQDIESLFLEMSLFWLITGVISQFLVVPTLNPKRLCLKPREFPQDIELSFLEMSFFWLITPVISQFLVVPTLNPKRSCLNPREFPQDIESSFFEMLFFWLITPVISQFLVVSTINPKRLCLNPREFPQDIESSFLEMPSFWLITPEISQFSVVNPKPQTVVFESVRVPTTLNHHFWTGPYSDCILSKTTELNVESFFPQIMNGKSSFLNRPIAVLHFGGWRHLSAGGLIASHGAQFVQFDWFFENHQPWARFKVDGIFIANPFFQNWKSVTSFCKSVTSTLRDDDE